MAKELMIDKVARIVKNPVYIRNICTSAHIHHGKCVAPNSRIILSDASVIIAEKLFSKASAIGKKVIDNENEIVYDVSDQNIGVFSLNKETGKIEHKQISHAWKLVGGSMIKVKLRNGATIATTPEHKFIVLDGIKFVDREAEKLKLGDRVICARKLLKHFVKEFVDKGLSCNIHDVLETGNGLLLKISQKTLQKLTSGDLDYVEVISLEKSEEEIVYDFSVPDHKNFVAEGMVIHNTAFTDNLLAAAGLMAAKAAGDLEMGMQTWQHSDEQERLMTVDAANVSMVHEYQGHEYLINLIDTPGHVDFGGNVTRAMRAIDGTVVLVCAVEGIMPQTETVLKQAIRERVKPVLFINKVDRLVKELQLSPEKIQSRFVELITKFNGLIERMAEPQFREAWKVDIMNGSVAFGSARENWALSFPFMQKKGVKFADILKLYELDEDARKKWSQENAPLSEVVLDMVIKHHPTPIDAQKYRIPKIWHGDLESEFGKDLLNCNPNGKLAFCVTRITIDSKSGKELAAGRLFSGTIRKGTQVYLSNLKSKQTIQGVYIYQGIKPEAIDELSAGNVLALSGLTSSAGELISLEPEEAFEELRHIFEPVITKAVEPTKPQDLPKVVEVLRKVSKEDPSIKIEINEETGENLMSGMGELHLEIVENRIKTEKGVAIKTSNPIVVFRETVSKTGQEVEGKSPNKHNKFYFKVEPLSEQMKNALKEGHIQQGRVKKKNLELRKQLMDAGMTSDEADSVKDIYNGNIFVETTRGQIHMIEVIEMILDMFEDVMQKGPLAKEPCIGVKVILTDMSLHEDAIHRGPAQVYPAVRDGIRGAMVTAGPLLFEPLQVHLIEVPEEYIGEISKLVSSKRGQILEMITEGYGSSVKAKLPVLELLGWASELRSATEGKGFSSIIDQSFEKLPNELQGKVISQIKQRKGLTDAMLGIPTG